MCFVHVWSSHINAIMCCAISAYRIATRATRSWLRKPCFRSSRISFCHMLWTTANGPPSVSALEGGGPRARRCLPTGSHPASSSRAGEDSRSNAHNLNPHPQQWAIRRCWSAIPLPPPLPGPLSLLRSPGYRSRKRFDALGDKCADMKRTSRS